jgi:DNA-directed RNA polymerase specialized sigma24 family protein
MVVEPQASEALNTSFPTTQWSRVVAAGNPALPEARDALAVLCSAYWYPLYAFIRRRGHGRDEAEDLVQGFFSVLLEKNGLSSVDRGLGRFRSFLLAACTHFLANRRDYDRAVKRGGRRVVLSIDALQAEDRYLNEPSHELTAERLFERRWATTLLDRVLGRLEHEMTCAGKGRLLKSLKPILVGDSERVSYAEIAAESDCSPGAARSAAHRLRARYRTLLREEIGRTLADPAGIESEIHDLFATFTE